MNVLRKLALTFAAAALLAPATRAVAQDAVPLPPPPTGAQQLGAEPMAARSGSGALDAGWNTQYGMLFSLQNVFTRSTILEGYGGGIGLQYNLGPTTALRFSVDASRSSNPAVERETTFSTPTGSIQQKSLDVPAGPTSTLDVGVSGAYLVRLGTAALSPYLGGGLSLGYSTDKREYDDNTNPLSREVVDNLDRTFGVGLLGQLGLEWRVHRSLSLFAEYGVGVTAFSSTSSSAESRDYNSGVLVQEVKSESTRTRFFNFDTGLTQGGALGVVAFF
jgi:outer membrane protein with beta-barrel domain